MKQSEIEKLSVAELQDELVNARRSYTDLKMAHAITPLDNPAQLRTVRRTIARLATESRKRELE
ncbi:MULTISPECIES: 50S ribosomal protein L29 [Mesonia]|uniref:50S ribosomal protein L29 n=1 Tax=Mesonia oceanica TaxID=2687242 RepID=A0AC61YAN9_9FLAO|nr:MULTISPECIES: 50S ribosomal protein L29 [Mesonia]MBJ96908.1 50S ribosomal protein L29 [Flavobacteriaceae bacterium]MAN26272.1 50S ribosomal protein L29 [Mesonia sp.]MAQ42545.1 50S ribosomal protein L29 [Mesonia sp.]MBJ97540.1 50S ribosomal protein L29 [Flavobacteriaceae bacterium]VVV01521.1 50S ribosomal protein L29 [Mesonia oceanica]|tara:strand:+ start:237 stop:428 length:192 start_codon:yes stop_codon:yes gene_type:complete